MTALLFTIAGLFSGSLMFSAWIARNVLKKDIRGVGDGNPGSTNVLKSGGLAWGGLALVLDVSKAAVPVGLAAQVVGLRGWDLVPVALAPIVGHAFSPWLGFKGGKAMAVSLGVWIGLTLWPVPLVGMVTLVLAYAVLDNSGWAAAIMFVAGLLFVLGYGDVVLTVILILNGALVLYKYRADLRRMPGLRGWLRRGRRAA